MQKRIEVCGKTILPYYMSGKNAGSERLVWLDWLLDSDTHGNEGGVAKALRRYIAGHEAQMPQFLWIPAVSPTAAELGTRENARGLNINREFRDDATEEEVRANIAVMRRYRLALHLSFHEDPDRTDEFYVYDTADAPESPEILGLLASAESCGFRRYTGYDDRRSILKVRIRNGYFSERWKGGGFKVRALAGQATIYTVTKGIAGRGFTIEVPGRAAQKRKNALVAAILNHFIALHDANAKRDE